MAAKGALIIGVVVLVLAGGGFFGAARMGLVKVPGITPPKKANLYGEAGLAMYGEAKAAKATEKPRPKPKPSAAPPPRPKPPPKPTSRVDPALGSEELAARWNGLEAPQLLRITEDWREEELARVLLAMDRTRVGELLALMEPRRASRVSRQIQRLASVVAITEER